MPGHAGIAGSELADSLAKSAHNDAEIELIPLSPMGKQLILRVLKKELRMSTWSNENTKESILYEVDAQLKYQLAVSISKSTQTLIHRLHLETAYTEHVLYRIKRTSSPACCCGNDDEDARHLLLECP